MELLIACMLLAPGVAWVAGWGLAGRREGVLYGLALVGPLVVGGALAVWAAQGAAPLNAEGPVLYRSHHGDFMVRFLLDATGAWYLAVAAAIDLLVVRFSRTYLHRDPGFRRFFLNLQCFFFGLVLLTLSGNLETLFIGWETVGVTSFFLIGFYRERYLPVRNALKVVSLYRLADVALLVAIWLTHHHFGYGLAFDGLEAATAAHGETDGPRWHGAIAAALLLAAAIKSGQVPFSSWVARAMEGPTASSAIFYGALATHLGVFLLLRTAPFVLSSSILTFCVGGIGLLTAFIAPAIARVQPSVKVQIAYASVGQIGWMFLWIALGFPTLALVHLTANAFLRAYQLLVSPSVLSLRMHNLFFDFVPRAVLPPGWYGRLRATGYVLGLLEFRMDGLQRRLLWGPLKRAGRALHFLDARSAYVLALAAFFAGAYGVYNREALPPRVLAVLPVAFAAFSLTFVLKAFVERERALHAWSLVAVNQLFLALALGYNEAISTDQFVLFLSGIVCCSAIGLAVLYRLEARGLRTDLDGFHGLIHAQPAHGIAFLLASLGLAGFPITPTFVGEDLLLDHVHEDQPLLLACVVLAFILDGLVVFRTYSRLFLGPDRLSGREVAPRSG